MNKFVLQIMLFILLSSSAFAQAPAWQKDRYENRRRTVQEPLEAPHAPARTMENDALRRYTSGTPKKSSTQPATAHAARQQDSHILEIVASAVRDLLTPEQRGQVRDLTVGGCHHLPDGSGSSWIELDWHSAAEAYLVAIASPYGDKAALDQAFHQGMLEAGAPDWLAQLFYIGLQTHATGQREVIQQQERITKTLTKLNLQEVDLSLFFILKIIEDVSIFEYEQIVFISEEVLVVTIQSETVVISWRDIWDMLLWQYSDSEVTKSKADQQFRDNLLTVGVPAWLVQALYATVQGPLGEKIRDYSQSSEARRALAREYSALALETEAYIKDMRFEYLKDCNYYYGDMKGWDSFANAIFDLYLPSAAYAQWKRDRIETYARTFTVAELYSWNVYTRRKNDKTKIKDALSFVKQTVEMENRLWEELAQESQASRNSKSKPRTTRNSRKTSSRSSNKRASTQATSSKTTVQDTTRSTRRSHQHHMAANRSLHRSTIDMPAVKIAQPPTTNILPTISYQQVIAKSPTAKSKPHTEILETATMAIQNALLPEQRAQITALTVNGCQYQTTAHVGGRIHLDWRQAAERYLAATQSPRFDKATQDTAFLQALRNAGAPDWLVQQYAIGLRTYAPRQDALYRKQTFIQPLIETLDLTRIDLSMTLAMDILQRISIEHIHDLIHISNRVLILSVHEEIIVFNWTDILDMLFWQYADDIPKHEADQRFRASLQTAGIPVWLMNVAADAAQGACGERIRAYAQSHEVRLRLAQQVIAVEYGPEYEHAQHINYSQGIHDLKYKDFPFSFVVTSAAYARYKQDLIALYSKYFTTAMLQGDLDFKRSPTGRAITRKQPLLTQHLLPSKKKYFEAVENELGSKQRELFQTLLRQDNEQGFKYHGLIQPFFQQDIKIRPMGDFIF